MRAGRGGRVERTRTATSQPPSGAASNGRSPSQFTSATATERLASAARGPTTTRRASASSRTTKSGSPPPMPRPRRWPTV